jgi:hypothetical protein
VLAVLLIAIRKGKRGAGTAGANIAILTIGSRCPIVASCLKAEAAAARPL